MHPFLQRARKLLVTLLLLLCLAWAVGEAEQQLLRHRAEKLLADMRSLRAGSSTWSDAQPILQRWALWRTGKPKCSTDACTAQIDIVQTLPPILIGTPGPEARGWIPRAVERLGLRSVAVRGGIVVEHGVVTARWFGEQVTLPVQDWSATADYVPYLSVSSAETSHLREMTAGQTLLHPNRMVQHKESYIAVTFSPQEDAAEQSALMDFRFRCITQLRPCESEGEILPEALRMLQERLLTNPTR